MTSMEVKIMKRTLSILVAVLLVALSVMPAFAKNPSPTASKEYKIVVHNNEGGSGTYTTKVDKDGKHATIVAHPKNGYRFVKWIINGKYEITKGDLNSKKLTILLKGNVEATPYFVKNGQKSAGSKSVIVNDSPTSPKTGDNSLVYIITLSSLALVAFIALGIKLAASKK